MFYTQKTEPRTLKFSDLLAIAFIVLKLCEVINWSWWWVLAPIWIPAVIIVVCKTVLKIIEKTEDE